MTIESILNFKDGSPFVDLKPNKLQELFDKTLKEANELNNVYDNTAWYSLFIGKILWLFSCGHINLHKHYSIPQLEEKFSEIKEVAAARIIQRRWRSNLRSTLSKDHKSFETWRTDVVKRNNTDPIESGRKIKKIYQETHYVFTHGQSLVNAVVTTTINQIVRLFNPELYHPHNIHFRIPGTVLKTKNYQEFYSRHNGNLPNDESIPAEVLSVDAYFDSKLPGESAKYYYENNSSGCSPGFPIETLFALLPCRPICYQFLNDLNIIATAIHIEHQKGRFYAICVPKTALQDPNTNFAYSCIAYGKAKGNQSIKTLENHQSGSDTRYQYRLLTYPLTHQKGARAFAFNNLSKEKNQHYDQLIAEQVTLFRFYTDLYNIKEASEEVKEKLLDKAQEFKGKWNSKIIEKIIEDKKEAFPKELLTALT